MTARKSNPGSGKNQRGYALLMVIFLAATVMIFAVAASLQIRTEGLREKETELAWRGNQYARAVRLYYKKHGFYPKSLDDLTAYHTDQPLFLRKAYKDPMNTKDGSWRLIYLLPNGQLQGSYMHQQVQTVIPMGGPLGGGTTPTSGIGGTTGGTTGGASGQPPTAGTGTTPTSPDQSGNSGQSSDQQSNNGPVFGGSIVGVASKINKPSLRVYEKGKAYDHWEFIDPSLLNPTPGGLPGVPPAGAPTGTQPPTIPGQPTGPGSTINPGAPIGSGQSPSPSPQIKKQ